MNELKPRIHDDTNGLDYTLSGDFYIPDLRLSEHEKTRPIGKWGRMHLNHIREYRPILYTDLLLSGTMGTYLADLNEQAQARLELIIDQMKIAEGVNGELKRRDSWRWVQRMNSIRSRAEEIVLSELIYT